MVVSFRRRPRHWQYLSVASSVVSLATSDLRLSNNLHALPLSPIRGLPGQHTAMRLSHTVTLPSLIGLVRIQVSSILYIVLFGGLDR